MFSDSVTTYLRGLSALLASRFYQKIPLRLVTKVFSPPSMTCIETRNKSNCIQRSRTKYSLLYVNDVVLLKTVSTDRPLLF